MLTDIFGIAIAFALIMTILSVIVTSLNQATQAVLRLRGRNLKVGLAAALSPNAVTPDPASLAEAHDIMNRCDDAGLRRQPDTGSLSARLIGPAVTWLDEDVLRRALEEKAKEIAKSSDEKTTDEDVAKTVDGVVERFGRLQNSLRNRYETRMRGVSLLWAVVVAVVFQLSAPQLIRDLSTDPGLRASVLASMPAELEQTDDQTADDETADDETANNEVAEAAAVAERTRIEIEKQVDELARVNITPWRHGKKFYTDYPANVSNIIGVLLTAILLTLGAPFWYDALKAAVKWRDVFAPAKPPETSQQEGDSGEGGKAGEDKGGG